MLIPAQGHKWPQPLLEAQHTRWRPTLYRTSFLHRATRTHNHTYSDWDNSDKLITEGTHLWDVGENRSI